MVDAEAVILEELDRLVPPETGEGTDWPAVVKRAGLARERGLRGGRRLAVVAPVLAIALLAPAFTLSAGVRSLVGFGGGPKIVFDKSRQLVSGPIGNGFYAHVWTGPSTSGGACEFVVIDHARSVSQPPASINGGAVCISRQGAKAGILADGPWTAATAYFPFIVELSIGRRPTGSLANWIPPHLNGSVYPGLHATSVRLEWDGGSQPLTLEGSNFVGGGPILYKPPFGNLPYYVVAYDAAGREVARKKLNDPSLYLVSEGWKSFTPL